MRKRTVSVEPWMAAEKPGPHRVELLLQLLVGIVDAELFKAVHLEGLEPAGTGAILKGLTQ